MTQAVPVQVIRQAIDLHNMIKRSEEECSHVKQEMQSVICNLLDLLSKTENAIADQQKSKSPMSSGIIALLVQRKRLLRERIVAYNRRFSLHNEDMLPLPFDDATEAVCFQREIDCIEETCDEDNILTDEVFEVVLEDLNCSSADEDYMSD